VSGKMVGAGDFPQQKEKLWIHGFQLSTAAVKQAKGAGEDTMKDIGKPNEDAFHIQAEEC
jgi:hypothetical protein